MNDFKKLVFQVRYPYTAGVLATIWLGTATLLAIDNSIQLKPLVFADCAASIIIALLGFSSRR